MINFERLFKLFLIIILTVINLFTSLKLIINFNERGNLILISIIFELVIIFLFFYKCDLRNKSILILLVLGVMRYSIIPSILILNNSGFISRSTSSINNYFNNKVIFILLLEILALALSIIIFSNTKIKFVKDNLNIVGSKKIYYLLAIIFILSILFIPSLKKYYSFITMTDIYSNEILEVGKNVFFLNHILMIMRMGIIVVTINQILNSKISKRKIISCVILAIILSSIYRGGNRGYLLMNYLSAITLMVYIFNKNKKIIIIPMVIVLFSIVTSITIVRNFSDSNNVYVNSQTNIIDMMQSYLAGPDNILISVKAKENVGFLESKKMLISDLLFTVPIIGEPFRDISSVQLFNEEFYGHSRFQDQIVPLAGEGYMTLGYLGAFILPFITNMLAIKLYYKFMQTKNLEKKYIYVFLSFWFSLASIYNCMILVQTIVHHSIGIIIFIIIMDKIRKKGIYYEKINFKLNK